MKEGEEVVEDKKVLGRNGEEEETQRRGIRRSRGIIRTRVRGFF